jgi:hypothetical protein
LSFRDCDNLLQYIFPIVAIAFNNGRWNLYCQASSTA